ncbi:hypothetical protein HMPREF0083_01763 [Aneurinibacillus aneurinilyticus ATCC 12856]|uniref:Uncharacterized protein n=1 Tax=Aneurinibacillus aneurinilyticus ATCC 12856 TaxID=649747 RepID=U1WNG5_ANEAE|nr:hypothetical protein HMPREF0083_01763 [Aneurinibacillus aneurinilyticus ATCC 12856]
MDGSGRKNTRWPFFCRRAGASTLFFFRISSFQPHSPVKIPSVAYIGSIRLY